MIVQKSSAVGGTASAGAAAPFSSASAHGVTVRPSLESRATASAVASPPPAPQ